VATQFPNQRLTRAEKISKHGSIEKWGEETIESILAFSGQGAYNRQSNTYRKKTNYDLAAGKFNKSDLDYVESPYGIKDYVFPATMTHYDIITPKLNLLRGEEIKRPFNWMVNSTGSQTFTDREKERKNLIMQMIQQRISNKLADQGVDPESEEGQMMSLKEINNYIDKSYKDMRAKLGQDALEYLTKEQRLQDKFNKGWFDSLVAAEEVYWTGIINGEPVCRVVNPMFFDFDRNEDIEYIDEASWAMEWRFLTASQVYDEYHDVLSQDQVDEIEEMKGYQHQNAVYDRGRIPFIYVDRDTGYFSNTYEQYSSTIVRVIRFEWKSLRKMGFLTYFDEEGQVRQKLVPEDYKANKEEGEEVEWIWINEVWEATKIGDGTTGDGIYVQIRPKPNQFRSMDNPSKCRLGYTGIIYNQRNSESYSLVDVMKPHQYLYNIVMYRLELAIARAKIPRSEGFDVEKWLYYMDVMGIAFINSMEEGKKGQKPTFNQFKEFDLTISNTINQYIGILEKLESMVGQISGVSEQRQGQIQQRELVGNVERSVTQSSHITEPYFEAHNTVKERVLTNLLEDAKLAWVSGKKGQYVMDDLTTIYFTIEPELFLDSDHAVFVSNSSKDWKVLETARQLMQFAMQQGTASFADVLSVLESDSIANVKGELRKSEEEKLQREQQLAESQNQATVQSKQMEIEFRERELGLKDEMNKRDNQTKLVVKQMEEEGVKASMAAEKIGLLQTQISEGMRLKEKQIDVTKEQKEKDREVKKAS